MQKYYWMLLHVQSIKTFFKHDEPVLLVIYKLYKQYWTTNGGQLPRKGWLSSETLGVNYFERAYSQLQWLRQANLLEKLLKARFECIRIFKSCLNHRSMFFPLIVQPPFTEVTRQLVAWCLSVALIICMADRAVTCNKC